MAFGGRATRNLLSLQLLLGQTLDTLHLIDDGVPAESVDTEVLRRTAERLAFPSATAIMDWLPTASQSCIDVLALAQSAFGEASLSDLCRRLEGLSDALCALAGEKTACSEDRWSPAELAVPLRAFRTALVSQGETS